MRFPPSGIGVRSIFVPLVMAIAVAIVIAETVPQRHHGGAGLVGVVAILVGTVIVAASAMWALNLDRKRDRHSHTRHSPRPTMSRIPPTAAITPLRSSKLRWIVTAYTINRLGTWFGFVALSVAVFDYTSSVVAVAALLICGQVLPAFLAPAVVARVETSARQGELSGLYVFEAAATAALAGLVWRFWLPGVLFLVVVDGTAALTASALLRAAAARAAREWSNSRHEESQHIAEDQPTDIHAERLDPREASAQDAERKANAAINVGFALTFTLGPALAGLAVSAFGAPTALLIDAASFVICAAMLRNVATWVDEAKMASVRARARAAWQYINETPALRGVLQIQFFALVFFEFAPPVEVAYAKSTLHAGDTGYGLLLGAWGLGVAIGSIVFARSIHPLVSLLSASTLAIGLAYVGWAIVPSLPLACIVGLVGGVGNGVQWAALISMVQRLTPQKLYGQVMGAVEALGAICPAVGIAFGGVIAALGSPREAFLIAGCGAAVSTIAFMRLRLAVTVATNEPLADLPITTWADVSEDAAALPDEFPLVRTTEDESERDEDERDEQEQDQQEISIRPRQMLEPVQPAPVSDPSPHEPMAVLTASR
jgi:hypothetical protein